MRTDSKLAVGSPTVRVAAIMVATLLLAMLVAGAGVAGQRLLAADDGTIVVAQDGSGTVDTIADAVAMAKDGDEILIKAGTYPESVTVDKDITIAGDGQREDVIVEIIDDAPTNATIFDATPHYAFFLEGTNASVGNLTVTSPTASDVSAFVVVGGSPTIHDVVANLGPGFGLRGFVFMDAAAGTIRDSATDAFLWVDGGSTPEIFDNVTTHAIRTNGTGTDAWIHDNVTTGVWAHDGSAPLVEENDISGSTGTDCGIEAGGPDAQPIARNNRVTGNDIGICLYEDGGPVEMTDNTITGNEIGLRVGRGSVVPVFAANIICDNTRNVDIVGTDQADDVELCTGEVEP